MKIAFLGDIALFGFFSLDKNPGLYEYLKPLKKKLAEFDHVIGNLETPFVNEGERYGSKSAYISSDNENIEILKYLGVNVVNLANNHIYDFGIDGLKNTISVLENNGIDWFGCFGKTFLIEKPFKLAFHGYCSFNTNPVGVSSSSKNKPVHALVASDVINNAKDFHKKGYLNCISVHSGIEHVNLPSNDDVTFARGLADILPYIYYGHHPHVLQGVENCEGSIIAYSLGNFCFDDVYDERTGQVLVEQSNDNRSSAILGVTIDESGISNFTTTCTFFDSDEYVMDNNNSKKKLESYSKHLNLCSDEFVAFRQKQISTIYSKRNSNRNLDWLVKRINFSTLKRVYERWYNKKLYRKHYASKVYSLGNIIND